MKINVNKAEALANRLETLAKKEKGIVGYKLSRNLRKLNTELVDYLRVKKELFEKYGEKDGNSLIIKTDSENYDKFVEEMKDIEKENIDVEFNMLTEDELVNSDLTGEEMYVLYDYMVE